MVIDTDTYGEPPMPPVIYTHATTAAEARKLLGGFVYALKRQYGDLVAESSEAWDGDVLTFRITGIRGRVIYGTVTVNSGTVEVEAKGDIPRLIESRVRKQIEAALAEALGS